MLYTNKAVFDKFGKEIICQLDCMLEIVKEQDGDAFWQVVDSSELVLLDSSCMYIQRDEDSVLLYVHIDEEGEAVIFPPSDVLHLSDSDAVHCMGVVGLVPLEDFQ